MGQFRWKLGFLFLVATFIFVSLNAVACGDFTSQVVVIRPPTVDALFSLLPAPRKMKVGDRFAIILPAPHTNKIWHIDIADPDSFEAFIPTDETGSYVYAWKLIKPGLSGVAVSEYSETLKDSRIQLFALDIAPEWTPPVINLDETNAGKTIYFSQRDVLKINLAHPNNSAGYWQIDKGLSELDIEYGGINALRGRQVLTSDHLSTEIIIDTTHMPGNELHLSFHAEHSNFFNSLFSRSIYYRLNCKPAPLC
jgi:hypothetical protein